jgi:hypothetical protein
LGAAWLRSCRNYTISPDHINPKGMGGAWQDDHPENIQAVHWWCNGEKGSSRLERKLIFTGAQTPPDFVGWAVGWKKRQDLRFSWPASGTPQVPVRMTRMPPVGRDCVENCDIRPATEPPTPPRSLLLDAASLG